MIETRVYGDPAACFGLAVSLREVQEAVDAAVDGVSGARGRVSDAWEGDAADAFFDQSAAFRSELAVFASRCGVFRGQVDTFAAALEGVQRSFAGIRAEAAGAGLALTVEGVLPPQLDADAEDEAVAEYQVKVSAYERLVGVADDARREEADAHERLQAAVGELTADPVVATVLKELGFLPGDVTGWALTGWGLGRISVGTGWAALWATRVKYGRFAPRARKGTPGTRGRPYISPAELAQESSWYRRVVEGSKRVNWQPRPYRKAQYERWTQVGRWARRAGIAVTGGSAALTQWQSDADDPSLGTTERVTRAATVGGFTGLGAGAGGWAGAKVGAGLGSLAGPVGTVVGGVVGGLIGGVVGAGAGELVGDWAVDPFGNAAEAAAEGISNAWDDLWD